MDFQCYWWNLVDMTITSTTIHHEISHLFYRNGRLILFSSHSQLHMRFAHSIIFAYTCQQPEKLVDDVESSRNRKKKERRRAERERMVVTIFQKNRKKSCVTWLLVGDFEYFRFSSFFRVLGRLLVYLSICCWNPFNWKYDAVKSSKVKFDFLCSHAMDQSLEWNFSSWDVIR